MNWYRLKTCIKCQGDLAADHGDWICLQCGTYYYTGLYQLHPQIDDQPHIPGPDAPAQPEKGLSGPVTGPLVPAVAQPASTTAVGAAVDARGAAAAL